MGRRFKFTQKFHGTGEAGEMPRHWTEYKPVPNDSPVAKPKEEEDDNQAAAPQAQ